MAQGAKGSYFMLDFVFRVSYATLNFMFPAFLHEERNGNTNRARALKAHHLIDSSLFVARERHTQSAIPSSLCVRRI